jgi:heptosyltransferase-2
LGIETIVILAPNWLGDAVMALPAIADVRRAHAGARLTIAARSSVAGVFSLVPGVDDVVVLDSPGAQGTSGSVRALAAGQHDLALLLPNSFRAAWLVRRAGVRQRWGYAGDGRGWLLTRGIHRPERPGHHVAYYQHLTSALGIPSGAADPRVEISDDAKGSARAQLREAGHDGVSRLIVLAPGAAYGTAKQWVPEHVTALISRLTTDGDTCVLVGSRGDASAGAAIIGALPADSARRVVNLIGATTLTQLAAVLSVADVCVSNDSGAMHLAAAVGAPVVATFGPTDERVTSPVGRAGTPAVVLTNQVWCRPCMLRECPIDHSCMTGITPDRVHDTVRLVTQRGIPVAQRDTPVAQRFSAADEQR